MMDYQVTYMARSGDENDTTVTVTATEDHEGHLAYYAKNLRLWGCGKHSATPQGAIRALVQDMATILDIRPL